MKVLVTGGAGYVGSVLVPLLLDRGHAVRVFDNLTHGKQGLASVLNHAELDMATGDIRDADAVRRALSGCDVIVHLAALVGLPACEAEPDLARSVNAEASRMIARAVGRGRTVIYASTTSNYGPQSLHVCSEDVPLNPLSHYGRTKTWAEQCFLEECAATALRFAAAFGVSPRMRYDLLVNELVQTAVTQGRIVVYEAQYLRTFIHVRDIARSILFAIEKADRMRGEVYNVGSDRLNASKADLCEIIREKTGCAVEYADVGRDLDQRNYLVSYAKIQALGYATTIDLPTGIEEVARAVHGA